MSALDPQTPPRAVIFGLAGVTLSNAERAFFLKAQPLGFILFSRNIQNPNQLKALTAELTSLLGRATPILIDQEGGRVQRMKPPHWEQRPAVKTFGDLAQNAEGKASHGLYAHYAAIAQELSEGGVSVNCAPVLDLLTAETDLSVGDRALSSDPQIVAKLGEAACRAHLQTGILPVIKHLPGLGRARLDTHKELPVIETDQTKLETEDFHPFQHITRQGFAPAVWGMVGHAVYQALDPDHPASCSETVITNAIRQTIGFEGLLLSDDLDMGALALYGSVSDRAARVLAAGCDIALQCNGKLTDMKDVAATIPLMTDKAVARYNNALAACKNLAGSGEKAIRQA